METKMNTEMELELAWLFEERTEDPCEHSEHESESIWHGGPGEWLIRLAPGECTHFSQEPFLVCDTYKTLVLNGRVPTRCRTCGIVAYDQYIIVGRKGVDF